MDAEKKRTTILAIVLVVVVLGVGVFKFTGGPGEETTPATNTKPTTDVTAPTTPVTTDTGTLFVALPPRDPFVPQESGLTPIIKPTPPPPPTNNTEQTNYTKLPPLGVPSGLMNGATTNTSTTAIAPIATPPSFQLTGVVEGAQTVALVTDDHGGQRLVRVNEMVDGEYRVKSISRQGVEIKHGKTTYVLRLGGTAGETRK
ncbi:MAG: hypothetical protein WCO51_00360 [bacterium]|jgi:hypothetical protein